MKIIFFTDNKIIIQLYENVNGISFNGNTLSFVSDSIPYNFGGFNAYYSTIDDSSPLNVGDSVTDTDILGFDKSNKKIELGIACGQAIYAGFTSPSTGYQFGFKDTDQANINEQATAYLMDSTYTDSITWRTADSTVVTLTRDQFMTIVNEARTHKRTQFDKLFDLEDQVDAATDVATVQAIVW